MKVTVSSRNPMQAEADVLALAFTSFDPEKARVPSRLSALDHALDGALGDALRQGDFRGKRDESLRIYSRGAVPAARILLVGLGDGAKLNAEAVRRAAGTAVGNTSSSRGTRLAMLVPGSRRLRTPAAAGALAEGAVLSAYRFETYKEKPKEPSEPPAQVELLVEKSGDLRAARTAAHRGVDIAESQNLARDLSNEPGNVLPPAALARAAQRTAREVNLHCRVLGPAELEKQGMKAILAVGGGSANSPRLIVMEHNRPPRGKAKGRKRPTICLVGKGVTFDSGGISIKPAQNMGDMKHDMSGAAAVVGAMRAVAKLRLPLHVVGVIGAAENLPSGTAYRPGDVVGSMSGKTIEVLNTDAEGRVVLADALHYARTQFEPEAMVDLATLTGACVIALGQWASGVLGSDDALVERLEKAGEASGERVWRLPLWQEHRDHVKGRVGDVKNTAGPGGGTITAAAFLSHFVGDTPWAHLDIAATAWTENPSPIQRPGATGVGVRLLVEMLRSWRR